MKKILITVVILAALSVSFVGCVFFLEETYIVSQDYSTCVEYSTADFDTKLILQLIGVEEGECPTEDLLGTCEDYYNEAELGESLDTFFYSTDGTTSAEAVFICEQAEGTWIPE